MSSFVFYLILSAWLAMFFPGLAAWRITYAVAVIAWVIVSYKPQLY